MTMIEELSDNIRLEDGKLRLYHDSQRTHDENLVAESNTVVSVLAELQNLLKDVKLHVEETKDTLQTEKMKVIGVRNRFENELGSREAMEKDLKSQIKEKKLKLSRLKKEYSQLKVSLPKEESKLDD